MIRNALEGTALHSFRPSSEKKDRMGGHKGGNLTGGAQKTSGGAETIKVERSWMGGDTKKKKKKPGQKEKRGGSHLGTPNLVLLPSFSP